MKEIETWLGLKNLERVESFDISNMNGFESVGSMVVFEQGKPKRNDYRKFKIKWVVGANVMKVGEVDEVNYENIKRHISNYEQGE